MISKRINTVVKKFVKQSFKNSVFRESALKKFPSRKIMLRQFSGNQPKPENNKFSNEEIFKKNMENVKKTETPVKENNDEVEEEETSTLMKILYDLLFLFFVFNIWLYANTENVDITSKDSFKIFASQKVIFFLFFKTRMHLAELYLNDFLKKNYEKIIPFTYENQEKTVEKKEEEKDQKSENPKVENIPEEKTAFYINPEDIKNLKRILLRVNDKLSFDQFVILDSEEPIFEFLDLKEGLTLIISKSTYNDTKNDEKLLESLAYFEGNRIVALFPYLNLGISENVLSRISRFSSDFKLGFYNVDQKWVNSIFEESYEELLSVNEKITSNFTKMTSVERTEKIKFDAKFYTEKLKSYLEGKNQKKDLSNSNLINRYKIMLN